ncbi:MAG: DUF411 domain-containing protein [Limnobacter sp.]|uniref:DUF411 domain-containing protein n=2 Tax=Limnobacter sp. TaxID=2003368 RepID=UPI00391959E6
MRSFLHHSLVLALAYGAMGGNAWGTEATAPTTNPKRIMSTPVKVVGLQVYKSPTCGCCEDWIKHLEQSKLSVRYDNVSDMPALKNKLGIDSRYRSCHTAVSAEGYVFEGHVPAKYIRQFLKEKPQDAIGLVVPGMPAGSPGMEIGADFSPYQVLLLTRDGQSRVYATVQTYESQF